jgi:hypothetical protein
MFQVDDVRKVRLERVTSNRFGRRRGGRHAIYMHIGAPKTGTTFLQRVLWQNRDRLRQAGVCYPGETFGAHVHAAFDLRAAGFHGHRDPAVEGGWARLVEACREWDGPSIISQELFSPARPEQVDTAIADLAFADVHLVYTARMLALQIPAAWQEDLRNRFSPRLDEFVAAVRHPDQDRQGLGRMFWSMQDATEVLRRWGRDLPRDRVHVITVPGRANPPDLLWRRFATVVGLDPDAFDIDGSYQNSSLGAAEAAVLQRLNLALNEEIGWPLYGEMIKHHLAETLAGRPGSTRIQLGRDDAAWAAERGEEIIVGLRKAGYDVAGSLDELRSAPPSPDAPPDAPQAPVEEQLDVAVEAIAALLLRISRLRRGVRQ